MIFTLTLFVLLQFLVHLEENTEAEIVTHDFKPRQVLHELIHQLEPGWRVKRIGFQCQEGLALVILMREDAQVGVILTKLSDHILDFL